VGKTAYSSRPSSLYPPFDPFLLAMKVIKAFLVIKAYLIVSMDEKSFLYFFNVCYN
jgi:hypothetical protein